MDDNISHRVMTIQCCGILLRAKNALPPLLLSDKTYDIYLMLPFFCGSILDIDNSLSPLNNHLSHVARQAVTPSHNSVGIVGISRYLPDPTAGTTRSIGI